jgi:hypothetical protein
MVIMARSGMTTGLPAVVFAAAIAAACSGARQEANSGDSQNDWFIDRAKEVGLLFVHFNGMSGEFYFPEMMPPGVGLLDYDKDGDLDVYLVQSQTSRDGGHARLEVGGAACRLCRCASVRNFMNSRPGGGNGII